MLQLPEATCCKRPIHLLLAIPISARRTRRRPPRPWHRRELDQRHRGPRSSLPPARRRKGGGAMQPNLALTDPTANGAAPKPLTVAVVAPLLADARALSKLLCLGVRTLRGMDASGKLPRPIKLGARTLWLVSEIESWLEAGAPDRASGKRSRKTTAINAASRPWQAGPWK